MTRHAGSDRNISPVARFLQNPNRPLRALTELLHHLVGAALSLAPWIAGAATAVLIAAAVAGRWRNRHLGRDARLIRIGVPPEIERGGAELLWGALHDILRPAFARLLRGQPHLSWEITAGQDGTAFQVWVPRQVPLGLIERAVTAAWPGASTTEVEDQPSARYAAHAAVELTLSGPDWFPLDGSDGADPLALVLGQLAGFEQHQRALVQILARPVTVASQQRLLTVARRTRAGIPTSRLARALGLLQPGPAARQPTLDPTLSPDVRAIMEKASRPLYQCLVRITVQAPSRGVTRGRIHAITGAFAAYEGRVGLRRRRARHGLRDAASRSLGRRAFILSIPELAALAHLPAQTALPGLVRAGARSVAPPPAVPTQGKPLGISDSGRPRPVAVGVAGARQHLHLLGATGAGKSTAIARMVLADASAGRGAVVIDPKGDLIDAILARVTEPSGPLVVLDPERSHRPAGLNVLQAYDRDLAAEYLVGTFRRMFEQFWGPRTDDILRACVLTLARDPKLTLAEIPTCLANPTWRQRLTAPLGREDPVLAGFWRWYDALSEANQVQAVGPLLNKLRAFLLRKPVRAIVGQSQTTFPLKEVMDGGLLLARLPKGTLGEDTSRLLGGLVLARVWQEALARSRQPEDQRADCSLYVDEVHNYLALPQRFDDLLAEARGYHLSLCLAHQNLAQLPRQLAEALSANARTKLILNCSPEDARALERHFTPELTAHDLANLDRYQGACRTIADGQQLPAFTLRTQPLPDGDDLHALRLRRASEQRFGRDPEQVEQSLRNRQLRALPASTPLDERGDE
jgi:hypothetical protein